MKLYDEVIVEWDKLIKAYPINMYKVKTKDLWPDVGNKDMILRSDMAYELGAQKPGLFALGATTMTSDNDLVSRDEIVVVGPELTGISEDVSYARLAICRVKDENMGEGDKLYNGIRKIEYTRYHVNPKGFMIRVSTAHDIESVRVSKEAVEEGISFEEVGSLMIKEFHNNPNVEAVKLIFITEPEFDYKTLEKTVKKTELITKTIDHIFNNLTMDCAACNLQEVCEEVEGMRELHQSQSRG